MRTKLDNYWLHMTATDLNTELRQLAEEGKDISTVKGKFTALLKLDEKKLALPVYQQKVYELFDETQKLPMVKGYKYKEPSDLEGIKKLRDTGPRKFVNKLSDADLKDRFLGAWLGRCCGCLLGQPVEGVKTTVAWPFLKETNQVPLSNYIVFSHGKKIAKNHPFSVDRVRYDTIDHMPIDDDTNYTTTGLLIMEQNGVDFTPVDVAQFWLSNIPGHGTCTAERIAYRNFMMDIYPPLSATYRNPYREWIGAQIRADGFGYAALGNPELAAEFAWRDAMTTHIKNGIYGEMLMAAMIAASPFVKNVVDLVTVGLSEIPNTSRLYEDLTMVLGWYKEKISYDKAIVRLHKRWDEFKWHDWTHTNSNAAICAIALLWSNDDPGTAMCRSVWPGFDTDCNGATVGSIMGMRVGAKKMPKSFVNKLNNRLKTSLMNNNDVTISDMALRTFKVYKDIAKGKGKKAQKKAFVPPSV